MNKKILTGLTMLGLVFAYALPFSMSFGKTPEAQASQSDYYLTIDGIDGETVAAGHEKDVQVLGFSWGASNPTTVGSGGSGLGAGKVHFQDFHFTKMVDKATPKLFLACASGKHIPKLTLSIVKPSADKPATYMKYTFFDVFCDSFVNSADPLVEEVSFTYQKINMEYTPISVDGKSLDKIPAGWDLKMNKAA